MPAHSHSNNGVASLGIEVLSALPDTKDVDGRNKSGHADVCAAGR
jgi:hypothetical protein